MEGHARSMEGRWKQPHQAVAPVREVSTSASLGSSSKREAERGVRARPASMMYLTGGGGERGSWQPS